MLCDASLDSHHFFAAKECLAAQHVQLLRRVTLVNMELESLQNLTQFCVTVHLPFNQIKGGFHDKKEYLLFIFILPHSFITPSPPLHRKIQNLAGHLLPRKITENVVFNKVTDCRMFYLLPFT